jgi:membrane peptidoglycan carboxypeptidase
MFKSQNLGSFTLGPTPINPLELSNVAATLASGGKWCPPSPIASITDQDGKPVPLTEQACQQVVDPGLAHTLANALSKDDQPGGTSAGSAAAVGWNVPVSAKTGTTETSKSSAFLAFTNSFAGASYVYGDNGSTGDICTSPLRSCSNGNVFGGNEPAHAWYMAMKPVLNEFPPSVLPPTEDKYVRGASNAQVPNVVGMSQDSATATLTGAGFKVSAETQANGAPKGTVVSQTPSGSAVPGSAITIYVSDGTAPAPNPAGPGPGPGGPPSIPGIPPQLPFGIPLPPIPGTGGN